ncbi:DinB family protein [Actinomycetospora chlora]|uniref:DinB family protein n=1 Tax=Actinomycetospora chlora TaxID=663608 RepID=UPI0031E8A9D1
MDEPTPGEPVGFQAPLQRRPAPPEVADEREALEGWLDYFRSLVVLALDGLDEATLRHRVPAHSGPSLLGIVKHLTDLERTWLVERWGGRGARHVPSYVDDPVTGFRLADVEPTDEVVGTYLAVCERGRDALAGAESLDDTVRDDRRGHIELRWILLHLITETARYAGQAQVLREAVAELPQPDS